MIMIIDEMKLKPLEWKERSPISIGAEFSVYYRGCPVVWIRFDVHQRPSAQGGKPYLCVDFSEGQEYELPFETIADAKAGAEVEFRNIMIEIFRGSFPAA